MDNNISKGKFDRLKILLEQANLSYFADPEKKVCLIRFGDLKNTDFDTIFLALQGSDDDIIVATLTLLDGEKGYHYPVKVLEECMKFNKQYGLLKSQYDERYGDIDLSYETWLATLPENLAVGIGLLASKGNLLAKQLKDIIKKKNKKIK
ncbi:hypothetical protein J7L68_02740 [bacterium]|nr:hypothetical protein [bacterium]